MWHGRAAGCFLFAMVGCHSSVSAEDALDRLSLARLAATHEAVEEFRAERRELPRKGPFREYRANLHVHSAFSHDSRGEIGAIVAAAKRAGTSVLMFNEHPADHYDYVTDGHRGNRDGVLLIPGAEQKGLLLFPRQSLRGIEPDQPQDLANVVRGRGGLAFLSHLEERMDWELKGLTGVEIYNTHADVKDEKRLVAAMRNPLWLLGAAESFRKFPQETFSALHDYPADYLRRWDELCKVAPHTGVAANDAHENVGITVRLTDEGQARIEDALGKKLLEVDASAIADRRELPTDAKPGTILHRVVLDPYEYSLRHVGTHLLLTDLSEAAVREALEAGRAFVAFDGIADATGFDFSATSGNARHPMGAQIPLADDLRLRAQAPLAGHWKLIRSGKLLAEGEGADFERKIDQPGVYRVEWWLDVAGQQRIWILSNPIYVAAK